MDLTTNNNNNNNNNNSDDDDIIVDDDATNNNNNNENQQQQQQQQQQQTADEEKDVLVVDSSADELLSHNSTSSSSEVKKKKKKIVVVDEEQKRIRQQLNVLKRKSSSTSTSTSSSSGNTSFNRMTMAGLVVGVVVQEEDEDQKESRLVLVSPPTLENNNNNNNNNNKTNNKQKVEIVVEESSSSSPSSSPSSPSSEQEQQKASSIIQEKTTSTSKSLRDKMVKTETGTSTSSSAVSVDFKNKKKNDDDDDDIDDIDINDATTTTTKKEVHQEEQEELQVVVDVETKNMSTQHVVLAAAASPPSSTTNATTTDTTKLILESEESEEEEEEVSVDVDSNDDDKITTKTTSTSTSTSQQQQSDGDNDDDAILQNNNANPNAITRTSIQQRVYINKGLIKKVYKKSIWCIPIRCLCKQFPKDYPRIFSIIFVIIIPLWFLILLGFGFGILLAQKEFNQEVISNNEIIKARTLLSKFDQADDLLLDLPTYCLEEYYQQTYLNLDLSAINTITDDNNNNNNKNDDNLVNSSAIVDGIFNDLTTFLDTFGDDDNDNNEMIELECNILDNNITVCDCSNIINDIATIGENFDNDTFDDDEGNTTTIMEGNNNNTIIDGNAAHTTVMDGDISITIVVDGNFSTTIEFPITIDGNITLCDLDCNITTTIGNTSNINTTVCDCSNMTTIDRITIDGNRTVCDFVAGDNNNTTSDADDATTTIIPDYESVLQETESILNQTGSMIQEELTKAYARIEKNAKMQSYKDIHKFVTDCKEDFLGPYNIAQQMQKDLSLAYTNLSFIWIRCWPENLLGEVWMEFYPTDEVVAASQPSNQENTFIEEWANVQESLYEEYIKALGPDATNKELYEAYLRSLDDATGDGACMENVGGTSWFFFTVMTTIGYGNQSPSTPEGRRLLYTAGLMSLILFGIILTTTSHVMKAIFDDFVSRFWISKFLKKPLVGAIMWGSLWFLFLLMIADHARWYWQERAGEIVERKDAVWFAYISTTTVGLGDYFLQPEVMFGIDTLQFSVTLLVGLVFLADFFGKVSDLVVMILPRRQNSLEARLKATSLFLCCKERPSSSSSTAEGSSDSPIFNDDDDDEIDVDMEEIKDRIYALETLLPAKEADGFIGNNTNSGAGEEEEEEEQYADYRNFTPLKLLEKEEEVLQALAIRVGRKKDALLSAMDREVEFQRW